MNMPKNTHSRIIDAFVRSRQSNPEWTTKTDQLVLSMLNLSGTRIQRTASVRTIRSLLKYAHIPKKSVSRFINVSTTWNMKKTAEYCKSLKPHKEMKELLEAYI